MRPVIFHGLFGHLHQTFGAAGGDLGVVIVPALGRDQRCAHGPMRLFADQLAAAGIPALRYDHRGEGDSLGLPRAEDDAMPLWMEGVGHAVQTLKAEAGVRRVVVTGLRVGGAMAAQAVLSGAAEADGLMLWAPVLSGRSWLRRQRFSAGIVGGAKGADDAPVDVDGICLSGETAASLSAVDLETLQAFKIPTFIAAQNRLVSDYAHRLTEQGTPVHAGDFPGFDALFLDTHSNQPAAVLHAQALHWLRQAFPAAPAFDAPRRSAAKGAGPVELQVSQAVERPVTFGADLHGVLCIPDDLAPDAPAVLFCNTGGDPRAGVGGFATQAARRLARNGLASLRFDFAGLGDSAPPQGGGVHVFQTDRQPDLAAALALLAEQGWREVIAVGVCTGAYHLLKATSHNPAIVGVFAVSPVKLMWEPGDSVVYDPGLLDKPTKAYARAARDPRTWLRLFSGDVAVGAVLTRIVSRMKKRLRAWSTRAKDMSPLSEMLKFTDRGGRACLLMGLNDASLDEVEIHFGSKGSALAGRTVSIQVHSDLDHGLARHASRAIAMNTLLDWLDLPASERSDRR